MMSERKGTKALELWCRRLIAGYNGVSIDNMTTSWRNGLAFCALIHRFRPDLIDFESLKAEDIYLNNELAFRTAETHLGIPALLDPEDMVDNEVPDRLSILTYLSQFYQRLGHSVTKASSNDNSELVLSQRSPLSLQSPVSHSITESLKQPRGGCEGCVACGLPVYLAQRLLISHKLYHRSCFRCGSCRAQLSPHACYENATATQFCCEACKNAEDMPALREQDDRMGMLLFHESELLENKAPPVPVANHHSISEKIKLFENNVFEKNKKQPDSITSTLHSWRNSDVVDGKKMSHGDDETTSSRPDSHTSTSVISQSKTDEISKDTASVDMREELLNIKPLPDSSYKSNVSKLNFLQTQLSTDAYSEPTQKDISEPKNDDARHPSSDIEKVASDKDDTKLNNSYSPLCLKSNSTKTNSNVPDDVRLEEKLTQSCKMSESYEDKDKVVGDIEHPVCDMPVDIPIMIPPRRRNAANKKTSVTSDESPVTNVQNVNKQTTAEYPVDLNPFTEDETEDTSVDANKPARVATNPFGSSDDEDDEGTTNTERATPAKSAALRDSLTSAPNPFWSDGEEPSTDEEEETRERNDRSGMYGKSNITSSTPNLPLTTPRRAKPRAPRPPVLTVHEAPVIHIDNSYSLEDGGSLSSLSSHSSTIYSDYKPHLKLTPKSRKKRPAPTPPDNASIISTGSGSIKQPSLIQGKHLFADEPYSPEGTWRRMKGPAPGLPLPGRRVVRPELSPGELQSQLDLLETQQLGLERQGVLIEQMIREKCEGEQAAPAPAEEVEDLVIQLCELVNEKNDLFRKQAELMYIRRQQRLEQEQADIEHEIRVIQSRPAVNRIDADKAREEQLVARLVGVVRLRDELVQQLDSERRRERAEDAAIAHSIAERRAKRNSDSNNSSLQSEDIVRTPKKSKVKDRMKKQLKKAKNTLNPKKKESEGHSKEPHGEKKEKTKWF